ncbi:MAG: FAD-dependent oxidoreductase [Rhodocyclaceae bacterium]|jgi:3-phenylpropionate/trans-cinnamate dioxygenase ferredoxin reductase subunit|nr:FAD-dependent oxidoreductase [Rhodocyclaceae bacterium]
MSSQGAGVVIIGSGQAGAEVATCLRQMGYPGRIQMVGEEVHLPYRRPPLSKEYLGREVSLESLAIKSGAVYAKAGIELLRGVRAVAIERDARTVRLEDGRVLAYDALVLATGGRNRPLPLPGAEASNVHYLRTIEESHAIGEAMVPGKSLVVIGGGYIGLEVAAIGIKHGLKVTALVRGPRVLARVTGPEMSSFYEGVHRQAGVDVRTGVTITALQTVAGKATAILLADGEIIPADVVVIGNGLIPSVELAQAAGLEVGDGILVDAHACTSDPHILAVGDVANHPNPLYGRRMRFESVPNATEQARTVAATICGKALPYRPIPWFWSNQYDLKLQMVGISEGYDDVVFRGEPASRSFSAFYLKDGVVIAADTVNHMQDFMAAKQLVARGRPVDRARLADTALPLKSLFED